VKTRLAWFSEAKEVVDGRSKEHNTQSFAVHKQACDHSFNRVDGRAALGAHSRLSENKASWIFRLQ